MDARRHRRADTVTSGPVLHMRESSLSAHACSGRAAQRGARPALRADQGIELGEYALLPVRRQKRAGARGPDAGQRPRGGGVARLQRPRGAARGAACPAHRPGQ